MAHGLLQTAMPVGQGRWQGAEGTQAAAIARRRWRPPERPEDGQAAGSSASEVRGAHQWSLPPSSRLQQWSPPPSSRWWSLPPIIIMTSLTIIITIYNDYHNDYDDGYHKRKKVPADTNVDPSAPRTACFGGAGPPSACSGCCGSSSGPGSERLCIGLQL